jgi:hypothetical protein
MPEVQQLTREESFLDKGIVFPSSIFLALRDDVGDLIDVLDDRP